MDTYEEVRWADIQPGDVVTITRTANHFRVATRDDRHGWWAESYGGGRRYRLTELAVIRGRVRVLRRIAGSN